MGRVSIVLTMCGATAFALWPADNSSPWYIWNASQSVPVGLYRLQKVGQMVVRDLVAVRPPEALATFLALNGYLPNGLPMLKRVLALPGQTVCRTGLAIVVDSLEIGQARDRDRRGRPLPVWQGCRILRADEIFVMNWQSADSFDGRYFGPIPASAVMGQAIPVWTDGE